MQETVKRYARPGRHDRRDNRLGLLAQMYMGIERLRVAQQVRQTHLKEDKSPLAQDPVLESVLEHLLQAQTIVDMEIKPLVLQHPCWTDFNLYVKGVGPHLLALVMGLIRDIAPFTTVSKLWYLCGLAVLDGKTQKKHKGETVNFDMRLRAVLLGRLGTQLLKNGDPFARKLYDEFKAQEEAKLSHRGQETHQTEASHNGQETQVDKASQAPKEPQDVEASQRYEETPSPQASQSEEETHVKQAFSPHRRAIRKVVKLWIACLWLTWRRAEGLPVTEPYPMGVLGHDGRDLVTPERWVQYNQSVSTSQFR